MDLVRFRPFMPVARYAFVIVTGLTLFSASTSYLGSTAVERLQPTATAARVAPKPSVEINVPSPVAQANAAEMPAPAPVKAAALTQPKPATPAPAALAQPSTAPPQATQMAAATAPKAAPAGLAPQTTAPATVVAVQPRSEATVNTSVAEVIPVSAEAPYAEAHSGRGSQVVVSAVNFRSGPSNGNTKLGVIKAGTRVEVIAENGGWLQVAEDGAVLGWVYNSFVSGY